MIEMYSSCNNSKNQCELKKKEQNNLVYSKKTLFGILAYVLLSVIKIVILINIKRKKKLA